MVLVLLYALLVTDALKTTTMPGVHRQRRPQEVASRFGGWRSAARGPRAGRGDALPAGGIPVSARGRAPLQSGPCPLCADRGRRPCPVVHARGPCGVLSLPPQAPSGTQAWLVGSQCRHPEWRGVVRVEVDGQDLGMVDTCCAVKCPGVPRHQGAYRCAKHRYNTSSDQNLAILSIHTLKNTVCALPRVTPLRCQVPSQHTPQQKKPAVQGFAY